MNTVAKVNGYDISLKEFQAELEHHMRKNRVSESTPQIRHNALQSLIDGALLLQQAIKTNIQVSPDELENTRLEFMMGFEDEQAFEQMLEQTGLTAETLDEHLERRLLIKKYVANVCTIDKNVPEEKLREIYQENQDKFVLEETVRVSHILISSSDPEAHERVVEIRKLINNEAEFKAIANVISTCPSNSEFGDLGWITRGKMFEQFDKVAFELEPGQIADPVESVYGWHIVMVTDKKPRRVAEFEQMMEPMRKRLLELESELCLMRLIKSFRAASKIEVFLDKI